MKPIFATDQATKRFPPQHLHALRCGMAGILFLLSFACSRGESTAFTQTQQMTSDQLATLLAADSKQSEYYWSKQQTLKPSEFAATILATLDNNPVAIDHVILSNSYQHFAATMGAWQKLDAHFDTIGEFVVASSIKINFTIAASDIRRSLGLESQDLSLSANNPYRPTAVGIPELTVVHYYMHMDCPGIVADEENFYKNYPSQMTYAYWITKNIRDQGNAYEVRPGVPEGADYIAAQWQFVANRIDGCPAAAKLAHTNPNAGAPNPDTY